MSVALMGGPAKRDSVYGGEVSLLIGLKGKGRLHGFTVVEATHCVSSFLVS